MLPKASDKRPKAVSKIPGIATLSWNYLTIIFKSVRVHCILEITDKFCRTLKPNKLSHSKSNSKLGYLANKRTRLNCSIKETVCHQYCDALPLILLAVALGEIATVRQGTPMGSCAVNWYRSRLIINILKSMYWIHSKLFWFLRQVLNSLLFY
jgi:hypothetical protein